MAQFVYMLPGSESVSELVAERGLSDQLGSGASHRGCRIGLSAGLPCMPAGAEDVQDVTVIGRGERVGFFPAEQTWERVEEDGKAWWLGWQTEDPPKEADLRRADFRGGYRVLMGGGDRWAIPPVRRYPEGSALPSVLRLNADGSESREILPAWQSLWHEIGPFAEVYYTTLQEDKDQESNKQLPELPLTTCLRLLQLNYQVGRVEVNVLGLITDRALVDVGLAAIDLASFMAVLGPATGGSTEAVEADPT